MVALFHWERHHRVFVNRAAFLCAGGLSLAVGSLLTVQRFSVQEACPCQRGLCYPCSLNLCRRPVLGSGVFVIRAALICAGGLYLALGSLLSVWPFSVQGACPWQWRDPPRRRSSAWTTRTVPAPSPTCPRCLENTSSPSSSLTTTSWALPSPPKSHVSSPSVLCICFVDLYVSYCALWAHIRCKRLASTLLHYITLDSGLTVQCGSR